MNYPRTPTQEKIYKTLPVSYQLFAERIFNIENGISALEEELPGLARMTSELEVLDLKRNLETSREYLIKSIYRKYIVPKLEELAKQKEEPPTSTP